MQLIDIQSGRGNREVCVVRSEAREALDEVKTDLLFFVVNDDNDV